MSPELIQEAEGWLEDCFTDLPADLTPEEIVKGVERYYEGGWKMFVQAACTERHWTEDKYGNEYRIECSNGCEY